MPASTWQRRIPVALTTLRLLLAPAVVVIACTRPSGAAFLGCLVVGFVSDVYDGILARRLGVATAALRRFDSITDVVFYCGVLVAIAVTRPGLAREHLPALVALAALEIAGQALSLARFGRVAATHSYAAKAWGVLLFACCSAVLAFGAGGAIVTATLVAGCVVDLEIVAILLISPRAVVDVSSIVQAVRARRVGV